MSTSLHWTFHSHLIGIVGPGPATHENICCFIGLGHNSAVLHLTKVRTVSSISHIADTVRLCHYQQISYATDARIFPPRKKSCLLPFLFYSSLVSAKIFQGSKKYFEIISRWIWAGAECPACSQATPRSPTSTPSTNSWSVSSNMLLLLCRNSKL